MRCPVDSRSTSEGGSWRLHQLQRVAMTMPLTALAFPAGPSRRRRASLFHRDLVRTQEAVEIRGVQHAFVMQLLPLRFVNVARTGDDTGELGLLLQQLS